MLRPTRASLQTYEGEQFVEHRCERCRHEVTAWVRMGGSTLTLHSVKVTDARFDAQAGARALVELARCPRCGHRTRAAVLRAVLLGAVLGGMAAIGTGFAALERLGEVAAWEIAGATVLAAEVLVLAWRYGSARRRVQFQRPA